ncbi:MAG: autotransporter-associated beta strand repeat-containing protein [Verrucomicrobiota bacterium]
MATLLQAQIWDGGGAPNGNWSIAANWNPDGIPLNDGSAGLQFGVSALTASILDIPWSINSLSIQAGASAYTFSGSTLTLGSGGFANSANVIQTFNVPIVLSADQSWSHTGTGTPTFNGSLSIGSHTLTFNPSASRTMVLAGAVNGSGTLIKQGAGALTLSADNSTFSGSVTLTSGALNLENDSALGAGTLRLNGGTLQSAAIARNIPATASVILDANSTLNNTGTSLGLRVFAPVTLTGDRTLTVNSGVLAEFTGGLGETISSAFTKAGTGTLVLRLPGSYTGTTTIAGGTLALLGFGNQIGSISSANLVLSGGVLGMSGTFSRGLGAAANQVQWSGSGGFAAVGGALTIDSFAGVPVWASTPNFLPSGAALILGSSIADSTVTLANDFSLGNAVRTVQADDNSSTIADLAVISGIISETGGTGGLTKTGTGALILTGNNTYSGVTTVSAGLLGLSGNGTIGTGNLTLNGGVFSIDGTFNRSLGTGAGQVQFGSSGGGFAALTTPMVIDAFNNPVWGTTAGFLQASAALTFGSILSSNVVTWTDDFSLGASGTKVINVVDNSFSTSDLAEITGNITSTGAGLSKSGAGKLILKGNNSFTGTLTVTTGTLNLQSALAAGTAAAGTSVASGATLELEHASGLTITSETLSLNGNGVGNFGALRNVSGDNSWTGAISLSGNARIQVDSGSLTLQDVSGSGRTLDLFNAANTQTTINGILTLSTLTKDSPGTLILGGAAANSISLATTIQSGTLVLAKTAGVAAIGSGPLTIGNDTGATDTSAAVVQLAASQQLNGSGTVALTINRDGRLDLNGFNDEISTLNLRGPNATVPSGGSVSTGAGVLTIGGTLTLTLDSATTLPGSISGQLNLGNATRSFSVNDNAAVINDLIVSAAISENSVAGITKDGTGRLVLSGNNTFTGAIVVNNGILNLQSDTAAGTSANGISMNAGSAIELEHPTGLSIGAEPLTLAFTGIGNSGALRSIRGHNSLAGNITLSSGSRINADADSLTLTGNISGSSSLNIGGAADITLSGILSFGNAAGSLIKDGSASLTISGSVANTMTGPFTVSSGTLILAKSAGLSATGTGTLNIGNDTSSSDSALGMVQLQAAQQINGTGISNVIINRDGALDLNGFDEEIGTLTIHGASSVAGGGAVTTGTGTLTLNGNVTLVQDIFTTQSATISGRLSLGNATRTFAVSNNSAVAEDLVISADITESATAGITMNQSGRLVLTGDNSFTGTLTVSSGTVTLRHDNAAGKTLGGIDVSGGTLELESISGLNIGSESLRLFGLGSSLVNVSGTNIFGGDITFVSANSVIQSSSGQLTLTGNVGTGNGFIATGSGNIVISGPVAGQSSGILKTGSGTLELSGANSFGNAVTINAGTVRILHDTALGLTSTGTSVESGAALEIAGSIAVGAETITLSGSGLNGSGALRNVSGNNSIAGNLTLNASSEIQADAGTLTLDGNLTAAGHDLTLDGEGNSVITGKVDLGSGGLIKNGSGMATLAGQTTLSGGIQIFGGTLLLGADEVLDDSMGLTLAGGTFGAGGFQETLGTLTLLSDSMIDLGAVEGKLHFEDSSNITWATGTTVIIVNWTGSTMDQLRFGLNFGSLTPLQVAQIKFLNPAGGQGLFDAAQLADGSVVPIPEPQHFAVTILLGAIVLGLERKRWRTFPGQWRKWNERVWRPAAGIVLLGTAVPIAGQASINREYFLESNPYPPLRDIPASAAAGRGFDPTGLHGYMGLNDQPDTTGLQPWSKSLFAGGSAGAQFEWNDNLSLIAENRESDFAIGLRAEAAFVWHPIPKYALSLNAGVNYWWYFDHPDVSGLAVAPDTHIDHAFFLGDVQLRWLERISIQTDPVSKPALTGSDVDLANFRLLSSRTSLEADWRSYENLGFAAGYEFRADRALNGGFDFLNLESHVLSGSAGYSITPRWTFGVNISQAWTDHQRQILNDSDRLVIGPTLAWKPTDRLVVSASAGFTQVDFDTSGRVTDGSSFEGMTALIGLRHRFNPWMSHRLSWSRNVTEGYTSNFAVVMPLQYGLHCQFWEKMTLDALLSWERLETSGAAGYSAQRYLFYLGTSILLSSSWRAGLAFSHSLRSATVRQFDYAQNRITIDLSHTF